MDIFELLPLIIGIIWFLSKRKQKQNAEIPRESNEPQADPPKSLEDIFRELERRSRGEEIPQEEEYDYDGYEEPEMLEPEPEYSFNPEEEGELQRQKDLNEMADRRRDAQDHRNAEKKAREEASAPVVHDIDLRQAIIYDAIFNRPDF